jgi:hypothetical protein
MVNIWSINVIDVFSLLIGGKFMVSENVNNVLVGR